MNPKTMSTALKTKLKTIQVTDDFLRNLTILRNFYTTDSKAIRDAVKLLAMERTGEVEVIRKK